MSRLIGSKQSASLTDKVTSITSSTNFTADATAGGTPDCKLLVVAGGGGSCHGGGGAGGYREIDPHPLPASSVPVTVGAGGAGAPSENTRGTAGSDSVFGSATPITSDGGGGGGGLAVGGDSEGGSGGSGGGGGGNAPTPSPAGAGNTPPVSPSQGNPGGTGRYNGTSRYTGGAGGGAGGTGGNETPGPNDYTAVAGQGGLAKETNISGSPVWYAGGGGGGYNLAKLTSQANLYHYGAPGGHAMGGGAYLINEKGGGGDSKALTGTAGLANTGGGGGAFAGPPGSGGTAGSGIVVISEPNATWSAGGVWDTQRAFKQKVEGNWR